ncbi:hypothetical protein, partial [Caballeronia arationis]|uniref:hypothetical protein n=1 Tax=Caballeronia arationis TaxID=1777142 RepID=UPI001F263DA2
DRNRALSCTWKTTRASVDPQFLLTNQNFKVQPDVGNASLTVVFHLFVGPFESCDIPATIASRFSGLADTRSNGLPVRLAPCPMPD